MDESPAFTTCQLRPASSLRKPVPPWPTAMPILSSLNATAVKVRVLGVSRPVQLLPASSERATTPRSPTAMNALPTAARAYVEHLEELAGVPISHVSVGPERDQMIVR